ncbi:hypothetical protein PUNSTDRAFT_68644, partial [Punctularia strigosozonata HHB-11173 SS5]|uniref:uncharacterized protein n=1 Tax=Punctularia strigosozonata (strain HHB-11173) TaxID=741275 RepID=UPI0004417058
PLFQALSYGAASVEADIWLVNGTLLVGHTQNELTPERTLATLYLDPLKAMLDAANKDVPPEHPKRGIYPTAPTLPLQLLIDIKSDGPTTFAALHTALEPLRSAGYLSSWNSSLSTIDISLVTVVGSGNTPIASVQALGTSGANQASGSSEASVRDIFLDGPLASVSKDEDLVSTLSPLVSTDFGATIGIAWIIPSLGKKKIRTLVQAAHAKGLQTRFWNTPAWPGFLKKCIWKMLLEEGSDWLNVDDLAGASIF